jgi:hypothetical protein
MDHSQRRKWQPLISMGMAIIAIAFLFLSVLGIWKWIMPSSNINMDIPEITSEERQLAGQLESHVKALSEDIGERNLFRTGSMGLTVNWISDQFKQIGYKPEKHNYELKGRQRFYDDGKSTNIIVEVQGNENPGHIVVIGAHYDSVSRSPGANDNASGVAVLLSLASYFYENPQNKTVRFVAFANEEPPFFKTRDMGSYAYAERSRNLGEEITAMIALDGLGYYSDEPGSQTYPFPGIGLVYPKTANYIGFVTRFGDMNLLRKAISAFREEASIPSEAAALPGFIPGVSWSDHWSFWQHDYSALLITDTLLFRDGEYHTSDDTPDRLDYERMARVSAGLRNVVKELSN